jgi:hypothetical protein
MESRRILQFRKEIVGVARGRGNEFASIDIRHTLKLAHVLGENSYLKTLRSGERVHVLEYFAEAWRREPLEYYAMKYASHFVQRAMRMETQGIFDYALAESGQERGGDSEK